MRWTHTLLPQIWEQSRQKRTTYMLDMTSMKWVIHHLNKKRKEKDTNNGIWINLKCTIWSRPNKYTSGGKHGISRGELHKIKLVFNYHILFLFTNIYKHPLIPYTVVHTHFQPITLPLFLSYINAALNLLFFHICIGISYTQSICWRESVMRYETQQLHCGKCCSAKKTRGERRRPKCPQAMWLFWPDKPPNHLLTWWNITWPIGRSSFSFPDRMDRLVETFRLLYLPEKREL